MTLRILTFVSKISATEFAIFDDGVQVLNESLEHVAPELHSLLTPHEQGRFRLSLMMETLEEQDIDFKLIDMIVTQTECTDVPCGIYLVNRKLVDYLKDSKLEENHQRAGIFMLYTFAEYINSNYDAECIPILLEAAIEDEIMRDAV
ncbi:MAG: hypothetical protein LBQ56_04370, partial [Synergistaceae bacterium]|nr:hypothetical protein [Synergistaceae bacterium]